MAKMRNFSRSMNVLLILIGWLQLAWMVSRTLGNEVIGRSFFDVDNFNITEEQWQKVDPKDRKEAEEHCPNLCYEVFSERIGNELLEAVKNNDTSAIQKLSKEFTKDGKKKAYSCESLADFTKKLYKEVRVIRPDIKNDPDFDNFDEKILKICKKMREIVCGSCVKHMHIRNPLAICLIILLILLIIGGIAVGVMFAMKVGPFKKRKANIYSPNAPEVNAQTTSNQYDANSNAYQNDGPGPGQPSQSPSQNFTPQ